MTDACWHDSWHLEIEDDVDPADADAVPVCDECGERLDRSKQDVAPILTPEQLRRVKQIPFEVGNMTFGKGEDAKGG